MVKRTEKKKSLVFYILFDLFKKKRFKNTKTFKIPYKDKNIFHTHLSDKGVISLQL